MTHNRVSVHDRRGQARIQLKEFEEARMDLRKVIEIDPGNAPARAALAQIAAEMKVVDEKDKVCCRGCSLEEGGR